jgi:hypothetical protein
MLVAGLALAGCAGTPPPGSPRALELAANSSDGKICRTEKVVGSNRPLRICRSAEQRTNEREHSKDFRDRVNEGRPGLPYDTPAGGG